jgi:hypothetical protein
MDRLLCLPETAVWLWGRFEGSERVELRLKKDTSLRLVPNSVIRSTYVAIILFYMMT